MRYALIFAGVAAAYDAYGYDSYPENKASSSSSTPAVKYSTSAPAYGGYGGDYKTSSAPTPSKSSSSSKLGYTTIYPGYGKQPVTVTSQYQPYPTCGAAGSDGKSCNKWNEGKYVSTVITDYNSKKVTVTYVEKPITVYQTKTTVTNYPTASASSSKAGQAYPTGSYGSYGAKTNATQPWYSLYEKIYEIEYKNLGVHGLPGYGGSGLCKSCDDEQPYKVKEYKNGKWSEYQTTAIYKAPTPETKTYEKPGVYTEPAKDVTVTYTMTKPSEATTTAKAGVPVTYGGYTTDFKQTGVQTCAYGAYETGKGKNGQDVTSTVVKTVTVTVSTTGKYEVAKPTTTVYAQDTVVKYPAVTVYQPGVYHKDAQTVTITKSGDSASCEYKQTKTYPVSTPSVSKSSSQPGNKYPTTSSAPYYPQYPANSSTPAYDTKKSSSTPCASSSSKPKSSSKPWVETKTSSIYYPEYPASSSTPVYNTKTSSIYYPEYPASSSTPVYNTKTSSIYYSQYPASSSTPVYNTKTSSVYYSEYSASSSTPAYDTKKSSSTPCASSSSKPNGETKTYSAYPTSTPVYSEYPHSKSSSKPWVETKTKSEEYPHSTPVYSGEYSSAKTSSVPSYPATTTVPHYENGKSTPCPSSTKPVVDYKSSEYPAASSSTPAYDTKPTPTPTSYDDSKEFTYAASPSSTPAAYPTPSAAYTDVKGSDSETSKRYAKRAGVLQRRQAAVAKRSNREIVA